MLLIVRLNDRKPLAIQTKGILDALTRVQAIIDLLGTSLKPSEVHTFIEEDHHAKPAPTQLKLPALILTLKLTKTGDLRTLHLSQRTS